MKVANALHMCCLYLMHLPPVMLNCDYQLDWIWHHLQDTPLSASLGECPVVFN